MLTEAAYVLLSVYNPPHVCLKLVIDLAFLADSWETGGREGTAHGLRARFKVTSFRQVKVGYNNLVLKTPHIDKADDSWQPKI